MQKLTKKHDSLARKFLTDISIAKEFLPIHLDAQIKSRCNLNSISIESGSYVEDDLKVHYSDILYKVGLKHSKDDALIYVLLEHQSTPDNLMPYRIAKYQLAIIQKYIENQKAGKLPTVIAMVFYNGEKSPYPSSNNIADLFEHKEIYDLSPIGKFKLIDLTLMDSDEILNHGKIAIMETLMKHIHKRDFKLIIDYIIKALQLAYDNDVNDSLIEEHSAI